MPKPTTKESKDAIDKAIADEKKKLDVIEEKLNDDKTKDDEKQKLKSEKAEIINMIAGKNIVWEIVAKDSSALVSTTNIENEIINEGNLVGGGVDPTDKDNVAKAINDSKAKLEKETDPKKKGELRKRISELQKILGKLEARKVGGFS